MIQYHNENSLSCVLTIAYLSSIQYYFKPIRELPTGRGFSDFVFLPKPEYRYDFPALVVELKWNKNAETALDQIKRQHYPASIASYTGIFCWLVLIMIRRRRCMSVGLKNI